MKYEKSNVSVLKQEPGIIGMYKHIEKVARTAYKTQDRITEDSYIKFCKMLRDRGHWACFEQGTVYLKVPKVEKPLVLEIMESYPFARYNEDSSFIYITTNLRLLLQMDKEDLLERYWCEPDDNFKIRITTKWICSRSTSMELIRHRAFSFLQESQRYVAYDKEKNGGEITYIIPQWVFTSAENYINSTDNPTARIIRADMLDSSDSVTLWTGLVSLVIPEVVSRDNFWKLCESEYLSSRKYLKAEDARGCLCNDVRTELCITGFLEDYIYEPSETSEKAGLFTLRTAMDAHPDIRVLANDLKQQFIDYGYYK